MVTVMMIICQRCFTGRYHKYTENIAVYCIWWYIVIILVLISVIVIIIWVISDDQWPKYDKAFRIFKRTTN